MPRPARGIVKYGLIQHQNRRAHVRVDVAEHLHDAGLREPAGLLWPFGIAAEVEAGRPRQRKHVVEDRIVVGKLDRRSARDGHHVRNERLVLLTEFGLLGRQRAAVDDVLQVDDDVLDFGNGRRLVHARPRGPDSVLDGIGTPRTLVVSVTCPTMLPVSAVCPPGAAVAERSRAARPPGRGNVASGRSTFYVGGGSSGSATLRTSSSVRAGTKLHVRALTSGGSSARSDSLSAGRMNVLMP